MNLLKEIKNFAHDKLGSGSSPTEDWYITVERAEGIKDTDRWSKSDTYVKLDFGGRDVKTHAINNDRTPYWNETFHFQATPDKSDSIHIKLMDDDLGIDDAIGIATIGKSDFPTYSGEEKLIKVPVLKDNQMTGLVHIRIKRMGGPSKSQGVSNYTSEQYPSSNTQQQQYHPQHQYQQPLSSTSYNQQQPFPSTSHNQQQPFPSTSHNQQQPFSSSTSYNQQQPLVSSSYTQSEEQYIGQPQGPAITQPQQGPYVNPTSQRINDNTNQSNMNYYGSQNKF
jgi:hypothetical protein